LLFKTLATGHTGANFDAIHQDGVRAALSQTTAEFWIIEAKAVAQNIEQWSFPLANTGSTRPFAFSARRSIR
jgi:hypothetical protein